MFLWPGYDQQVRFIRNRWPSIGFYADHPLGKWFFDRMRKHPWQYRWHGRTSLNFASIISLTYVLNVVELVIHFCFRRRSANMPGARRNQPAAWIAGHEKGQLHEIWLTGLSCYEMATIEVLLALGNPWRRPAWWLGLLLWNGLGAFALYNIISRIPSEVLNAIIVLILISLAVFWNEIYLLLFNANRTAQRAILDLFADLEERRDGKAVHFLKGSRKLLVIAAVAGFFYLAYCAPALVIIESAPFLIMLAIYFLVFTPYFLFTWQPQKTQSLFSDTCSTGQAYFAELIRAESERDLAEHRR